MRLPTDDELKMTDPNEPAELKLDEEKLKAEVHLKKSMFAKSFYVVAGSVSMVLGVIGLLLPVIPTTPFLLLAAFCYARGSERFYLALMENRVFGSYIQDWRDNNGIPRRTKIFVIALLVLMLGTSIVFVVPTAFFRIILTILGLAVCLFIWIQPTKVE